jgi:uncharacterized protein
MKIVFIVNTPGQLYTWINIINVLKTNHEIKILARKSMYTLDLLDKFGILFNSFKPLKNKYLKIFEILNHLWNGYKINREFGASLFVGFGIDAGLLAKIFRKQSIVFTDNEATTLQNILIRHFSDIVVTPKCFLKSLGPHQLRIDGFKELAYLHPNHFRPDISIYDELGIRPDEKYVILRFGAFCAFHDVGKHGLPLVTKYDLVSKLQRYAKVYISSEYMLPDGLKAYALPVSPERIHHVLYYAQMLVSDTGTMTTESALLGTPSVQYVSSVRKFGNFVELEDTYGLMFSFADPEKASNKAVEIVQTPDLKYLWANKRKKLLSEKIDVTNFMIGLINIRLLAPWAARK